MSEKKETFLLEEKAVVIRLLQALFPGVKIYLFCSRACGTHSVRSDIDLALDAGKKLSIFDIEKAKNVLDALNVPQGFDVVDMYSIPAELKESISKEGILWSN